ncbi:hypothetical protein GC087_24405 (plasmid) [Pantoea sp. JZ2]|nr:hypothetical protein GC087_24405 [Pantoea sp. JZ2]
MTTSKALNNQSSKNLLSLLLLAGFCGLLTVPVKPPGEGWFTGSIHDTDDGPVCVWLRPLTAKADE